jgi:hypothetical protein
MNKGKDKLYLNLKPILYFFSEQEKAHRWHDLQMRIHGRSQSRQGRPGPQGSNRPRNLRSVHFKLIHLLIINLVINSK